MCTTSSFKHWCCVSRILGSADPPLLLRLWCHRITVSCLVVVVHQQLGRDWLTLPSLSGLKSCDSDLNCKWMGHHGKANAAVKNGRKRSSSAVFLDLPPDRFCIICIWTLVSISSNLYRQYTHKGLTHGFLPIALKPTCVKPLQNTPLKDTVTWMGVGGIMPC